MDSGEAMYADYMRYDVVVQKNVKQTIWLTHATSSVFATTHLGVDVHKFARAHTAVMCYVLCVM